MKTVAFLNQKGGVGKTSTVHHLSGALSRLGKRILLVDTDPQGNLTQGLLGATAARELRHEETAAAVFEGGVARPIKVSERVSIIPGSEALHELNAVARPWETGADQFALRDAISEIAGFDVTLIDCPPHVYMCAWSAMVAADGLVVPLQAEDYGALGVPKILDNVDRVKKVANPHLRVLGYLITMYNKGLTIHGTYEGDLRGLYGDLVFPTTIPLAKDYKEAIILRQTVDAYKPRSAAAKAFGAFALELLARLEEGLGKASA